MKHTTHTIAAITAAPGASRLLACPPGTTTPWYVGTSRKDLTMSFVVNADHSRHRRLSERSP